MLTIPAIKIVYDYEPKELASEDLNGGYPAATISALSHANDFHDLAGNARTFAFVVRLYYPTSDTREADAEYTLRSVMDSIITTLEYDVTLGGSCEWAKPTEASWSFQEREIPLRAVDLTIECQKRTLR
jgi:hypothetical protein